MVSVKRRSSIPIYIFCFALVVAVVIPALYSMNYGYLAIPSVFADVVGHLEVSRFVGIVSDMGISLWIVIAVHFVHALYRLIQEGKDLQIRDYAFYGVMTLIALCAAVDDRLMIHEWLWTRWRIPELAVIGCYVSLALFAAMCFRGYGVGLPKRWFWAAVLLFTLSIVTDQHVVQDWIGALWNDSAFGDATVAYIEEGSKWIGIVCLWMFVFLLTADPPYVKRVDR